MSMRVSYKKQVLFGVMLLAVLFGVAEGLSYTYEHLFVVCDMMTSDATSDIDFITKKNICGAYDMIQYDYSTGHRQIVPNQHNDIININSHGFRGPEFSESKPDDTYRIFVLGGSTMYGWGTTSDSTTIPGHLQAMYDEQDLFLKTEVINAGIPNIVSFTEHWMIKTRLLDMDPDLFIIYDGLNDAALHFENPGISEDKHLKILSGESTLDEITAKQKTYSNVFSEILYEYITPTKTVQTLIDIRDILASAPQRSTQHDNTPIDKKVSAWVDRWNEICNVGKEQGFDVMVVTQPILSSNSHMSEFTKRLYEHNKNELLEERLEHYAKALSDLESCTVTLDLRKVLYDIDRQVYIDAWHLNDFGNKIVASAIFERSYPIVHSQ